jgi:cyanophycinase-like exopeptidase
MITKEKKLIAIGGGNPAESRDVLDKFLDPVGKNPDSRPVVTTIAAQEPEAAAAKYNTLFRRAGIKHVGIVDVSQRDDSFNKSSLKKNRL